MTDPIVLVAETSLKSPVPKLLNSNEEPNEDQKTAILEVIRLASNEMALQSTGKHEDRARQIALATFIHVHRAVLSPIRRIPAEILQHIFAYLVDRSGITLFGSPPQLSVCRLWHRVASSFPELLAILPPLRLTRNKKFIASLEARIAKVPLSVLLSVVITDCISQGQDLFPKARHPVAQTVYQYSKRWKFLTMTVDSTGFREITAALAGKLPNLHTLKLHVPFIAGWQMDLGRCQAFSIAPLLREVEVECQAANPTMLRNLPWHQLTTYKERSRHPIGLAQVLTDRSAIQHVEYRTTNPISAPGIWSATLTELQSLDFRLYGDIPYSGSSIGSLTTPTLQNIRIRDQRPVFLTSLVEFLLRSSCGPHLTRLSFHTNKLGAGDIIKILLLTPVLTELECDDIPFPDLCLLYPLSGKFTLVPRLQNLIIHSPTLMSEIEKLAQSRSQHTTPDRSFRSPGLVTRGTGTFSVRLVFTTGGLCCSAAEQLTISGDSVREITTSLPTILAELDIILDECKASQSGRSLFGMWQPFSDRSVGRNLDGILSFLETVPLDKMPEFYVWILSVLHKFWTLDPDRIPHEGTYHLLRRVTRLIYLWKLQFRDQNICQGFIRHGRFCLLYYSPGEGLKDRDLEWTLLHGRHKIVDDREVFWPHRDFSENDSIHDYLKWRRSVGLV